MELNWIIFQLFERSSLIQWGYIKLNIHFVQKVIIVRVLPLLVTSQATSKSSRSSTGRSSSSQAGSSPLRDVMDSERDSGILKYVEVQQKPPGLGSVEVSEEKPFKKACRWRPWAQWGQSPRTQPDKIKGTERGKELPPRLLRLASTEQQRILCLLSIGTYRYIRVKGWVDLVLFFLFCFFNFVCQFLYCSPMEPSGLLNNVVQQQVISDHGKNHMIPH